MMKRFLWFTVLLLLISLTACGGEQAPPPDNETPAETPAAGEEGEAAAPSDVSQYGQVTDVGGIDDKGFNQLAWQGMQRATEELGVEVQFLESQQQTDYEKNLNEFLNQGYNGIITVGFLLADATKAFAEENPDTPIAIVDFPAQTSNDMGLLFAVEQPAFQAGYLAAAMSETGIVCTYGGVKIPPVTSFMIGFEQGLQYYNEQNEADVQVLGWETDPEAEGGGEGSFTGNFESLDDGRSFAENFFDEGCDIIMPVAGPVGLGSAAAAQDRGFKIIGVDADLVETAPEFSDVYLTSVLKKIDVAVFQTITQMEEGTFEGGTNYISTLENGGVGLAPFHEFEDAVSQELRDELAAIESAIIAGEISPTGGAIEAMPEEEAAPAEEGESMEEGEAMEEEATAADGEVEQYGQVTDVGGIDDKGFNQLAWMGMQHATEELGVEVQFLESQQQTDYEKNLNEFLSQEYEGIITVGFLLADATKAFAEENPDVPIAIVDFPAQTDSDMGLLFAVEEPSFMAGYLAAAMSETGTVCTYGGVKIPPVTVFMIGFEQGVNYYNEQNEADVQVLGWETDPEAEGGGEGAFTGNFESLDDGRSFAENFFDEGCDIIFPVAGPVGLGSAAAAQDRGFMVIGVDADLVETAPEFSDVYLTSVLKKIDNAVFDAVSSMHDGSFEGGTNRISTLENGGVGLAPFHEYEDAVPQELRDELATIETAIIAGEISPTGE